MIYNFIEGDVLAHPPERGNYDKISYVGYSSAITDTATQRQQKLILCPMPMLRRK
jgi:hypothetical protein